MNHPNKNASHANLGRFVAGAATQSVEVANSPTAAPVPTSRPELRYECDVELPALSEQGALWVALGTVVRTEYTETQRGRSAQRVYLNTGGEHPVPFFVLQRGGVAPLLAGDMVELRGSLLGSSTGNFPWVRCESIRVLKPSRKATDTAPSDALDWSGQ